MKSEPVGGERLGYSSEKPPQRQSGLWQFLAAPWAAISPDLLQINIIAHYLGIKVTCWVRWVLSFPLLI